MADQPLPAASRLSALRRLSVRLGAPFPGALASTGAGLAAIVTISPLVGEALIAAGLFVAATAAMLAGLERNYPHGCFGACNAVTHFRLALVSVLAGSLVQADGAAVQEWTVFGVAVLALGLDGVDGWLARRQGLASTFGARFDMEVDCALALLLALIAWRSGAAGTWVLALGAARYAFWAASLVWPWLARPLPDRQSRKAVCVLQIAVLTAIVAPPVPPTLSHDLVLVAIIAVVWSFAVDVRYLHAIRR